MSTEPLPSNGTVNILIVEDSPTQAQQLQRILEQRGYHVAHAANGRLALESARNHRPAVVISDVVMPEMDGYELCREIKGDPGLSDVPVILVTTLSDPADVIRGLECRADNFILKPYDEQYLVSSVQFVLMNREMRKAEPGGLAVEIFFNSQRHLITADRLQILNLLLSTYEAAIQRNHELRQTQATLRELNASLAETNRALQRQMEEREQLDRALRESEQRLRRIVDNMAAFVGEMTPDGVLMDINQSALDVGGVRREDVVGQPLEQTWWFSHFPAVQAEIRADIERARRGEAVRRDVEIRAASGVPFTIDFMLAPVRDDQGHITKLIPSGVDITDRKRIEQDIRDLNDNLEHLVTERTGDLRDSEERFRQLAQHSSEVVWFIALNPERTLYVSPAVEKVWGLPADRFYADADTWAAAIHPEDRSRVQAAFEACARGQTPRFEEEYRILKPDESLHWVLDSGAPIRDERGEIVRLSGVARDITERKHLEAQFLQAQKMESVGQLAGGIAHDFNNLLTVINGTTEFAAENLAEGDPLREDLATIRDAGIKAAALTRQLLAFSRKQIIQPAILNLNTVVAEAEAMLRRVLGEHITLLVRPDADLASINADAGQIEQVVMNLAINSRDAMPMGGTLTIETANIVLDESYARTHAGVRPGPHVLLAISDTGIGMDDATRKQIFEPFFTTKGPGKGTGLGMSTSYGIVKQSGGDIWVYSEPGQGTTIKIYLPRASGTPRAGAIARSAPAVGGTETILVVEDDDGIRQIVQRVLGKAGYKVLLAGTGQEALRLLERDDALVDLVLTDVVMPGMSGRELVDRIGASQRAMKILYTSGYTDDAIVHHGVLDEGVHFISKPYTAAALTRKVREVLDAAPETP
ncbi:MAG: response regulator [Acidobacteriota bacterium]|nr:response regulator [Acidobacteriota bacterium]